MSNSLRTVFILFGNPNLSKQHLCSKQLNLLHNEKDVIRLG